MDSPSPVPAQARGPQVVHGSFLVLPDNEDGEPLHEDATLFRVFKVGLDLHLLFAQGCWTVKLNPN